MSLMIHFGDEEMPPDYGGTSPKVSPDILALQARVQQLEAALEPAYRELREILARDGRPYTFEGRPSSVDEDYFRGMVENAKQALSTPPLDVSPLWGVLWGALVWMHGAGDSEEDGYLEEALIAITPELRALIEEMAKKGKMTYNHG